MLMVTICLRLHRPKPEAEEPDVGVGNATSVLYCCGKLHEECGEVNTTKETHGSAIHLLQRWKDAYSKFQEESPRLPDL
jgi:hypothetical protein